ncbi:MAG: glycosyltransferase [Candidatus Omnitrophota bacterium]|nr:MAG: glycosyltransferase [Candidatus Omnitrophota bacterium]
MKILLLTTHLNPGGIPRYVLNLAKGLKARGHEVWVASNGGNWCNQLQELGIVHKRIPIRTKSFLSPKVFFSLFTLLGFINMEKI